MTTSHHNALLASILVCLTVNAKAQQVCEILARSIQQDVLIQGSDLQRFESAKSAICNTDKSDYSSASKSSFDGTLSVPDIVDLSLGTKSDSSNWGSNYHQYCSATFSISQMSNAASLQLRTSNKAAYDSVVACAGFYADKNGLFGVLAPSSHHDSMNLSITRKTGGVSGFKINSIVHSPQAAVVSCGGGLLAATPSKPIAIRENQLIISCTKPRDVAVTLAVNTSEGTLGPYEISAENDELDDIRTRLALLEGRQQPEHAVVYFNQRGCPRGWQPVDDARGRYIVGLRADGSLGKLVGKELVDVENRPTGDHTHNVVQAIPNGIFSMPTSGGITITRVTPTPTEVGVSGGATAGTNAPYIQFLVCEKVN